MKLDRVIIGDCRAVLPTLDAESVQAVVTSPPYWGLRDYGHKGQIGLETTPTAYVEALVAAFREVRRVLRDDGTLWLNLGDSYAATTKGSGGVNSTTIGNGRGQATNAGSLHADRRWHIPDGLKPKDLCGIPWRVAFALQSDGWYLRADIIWAKPNPMPESVKDRPTKAHEMVFLLSKSERYFYDLDAIREPVSPNWSHGAGVRVAEHGAHVLTGGHRKQTRRVYDTPKGANARSVWTIPTQPFRGSHFATMPPKLAERCILAGSRPGDLVLDPFIGSGTVGEAAERLGRRWLGIDLGYAELSEKRTAQRGIRWA